MRVTAGLAMVGWLALQPALETLAAQIVAEESAATQDSLAVVRDPLAIAVPCSL